MWRTDKIAILMAAYNGEKYIEEQLASIIAQTEHEWELFIHDDGSTDRTVEIIRRFEKRFPEQIHILTGAPCGGAKNNFFFLMSQVQAPYVMFCDQDDVWQSEKIEKTFEQMKTLEEQAGQGLPLLVFSDLSVVDADLNLIAERMSVYQKLKPQRIRTKDLMIQNVITGCTVMINRALVKLSLSPESTDDVIMHDWWCALIAAQLGKIAYVDSPLVLYRQHGHNTVGAKNINGAAYILAKLENSHNIRDSLTATQRQADFFARTYSISDPVLRDYAQLRKMNKVQRLWFYAKNGVWKNGWQRNLGLLIWG